MPTPGRVALGLTAAALLAQGLPAVTTWGPMRNRLFPTLAGRGRPDRVALTFDDGPDPDSTPRFLDELDRLDVRATFFMVAERAVREPALTRRVVAEGHDVALHGWDHRNLLLQGPRSVHISLAHGRNELAELAGSHPRFFRPAYGVLSGSALLAANRLRMRTVLWTGWGRDWTTAGHRVLRPRYPRSRHRARRDAAAARQRRHVGARVLACGAGRAAPACTRLPRPRPAGRAALGPRFA